MIQSPSQISVLHYPRKICYYTLPSDKFYSRTDKSTNYGHWGWQTYWCGIGVHSRPACAPPTPWAGSRESHGSSTYCWVCAICWDLRGIAWWLVVGNHSAKFQAVSLEASSGVCFGAGSLARSWHSSPKWRVFRSHIFYDSGDSNRWVGPYVTEVGSRLRPLLHFIT